MTDNKASLGLEAILASLDAKSYDIDRSVVENIYNLEQRLQYHENRGDTVSRIQRIIDASLTKD